jgi:hypothetical protein
VKKSKRAPVIVDTNVPVVANHTNGESLECSALCAARLYDITRSGVVVIDEDDLIFEEYRRHLSFAGQPGAGDFFFKWLSDNRYRPDRVERVALLEDAERQGEFAAFPTAPELSTFDRSDRKFVAAALTHSEKPPILNAVDSDWWNHKELLAQHGVVVRFLCGESRFERD